MLKAELQHTCQFHFGGHNGSDPLTTSTAPCKTFLTFHEGLSTIIQSKGT